MAIVSVRGLTREYQQGKIVVKALRKVWTSTSKRANSPP